MTTIRRAALAAIHTLHFAETTAGYGFAAPQHNLAP